VDFVIFSPELALTGREVILVGIITFLARIGTS
jgi:hypothetical protein